jgi:hypothetical protein
MYFVYVYENRTMKTVEIDLKEEGMRETNGEDESNQDTW